MRACRLEPEPEINTAIRGPEVLRRGPVGAGAEEDTAPSVAVGFDVIIACLVGDVGRSDAADEAAIVAASG